MYEVVISTIDPRISSERTTLEPEPYQSTFLSLAIAPPSIPG